MQSEIKVSVIIYVKNTIDYIEQCIRSVMGQTLQEIEIIVIDGGSTDGTLDVVTRLANMDNRIRLYHGISSVGAQFNLGLKKARGQYIGVCEADDYILPDMYEKQYRIAKENKLDVIRAGYYQFCVVNGREFRYERKACDDNRLMGKVIESRNNIIFLEQGINGFWSGIYRKQFLVDNHIGMNETKGAAYQDISFSFLTQMYADRFWFMEEAFYCYRIDNLNASVNSPLGATLHMKEYRELEKRLKDAGKWEQYKNVFLSWELSSYRWFLRGVSADLREMNARNVYACLAEQVRKNKYDMEQVLEGAKVYTKALSSGESDFLKKMIPETEQDGALLTYFKTAFDMDKTIILFGVGCLGKIVMQFLELHGKEVFLMDNNYHLQEKGVNGKTVYKPEELIKRCRNDRYVIAASVSSKEMEEQLLCLGIEKNHILIIDNEEFFLRKIFAKKGLRLETGHEAVNYCSNI